MDGKVCFIVWCGDLKFPHLIYYCEKLSFSESRKIISKLPLKGRCRDLQHFLSNLYGIKSDPKNVFSVNIYEREIFASFFIWNLAHFGCLRFLNQAHFVCPRFLNLAHSACPHFLNLAHFACHRFLGLTRKRDTQNEPDLGSRDTQIEPDLESSNVQN